MTTTRWGLIKTRASALSFVPLEPELQLSWKGKNLCWVQRVHQWSNIFLVFHQSRRKNSRFKQHHTLPNRHQRAAGGCEHLTPQMSASTACIFSDYWEEMLSLGGHCGCSGDFDAIVILSCCCLTLVSNSGAPQHYSHSFPLIKRPGRKNTMKKK